MHIIFLRFTENRSEAARFMEEHKTWIKQGFADGVFLLAGSLEPDAGGSIFAHNASLPELRQRVAADPFVSNGIVSAEILEISPARVDQRLAFLAGS